MGGTFIPGSFGKLVVFGGTDGFPDGGFFVFKHF
jgi:hypothetical protein